ncbi:response regulator [Microlunatus sp. Y2014]|uniref:response regulator n=1 Tax=Microlunatus sp. Y2014 TaxID=3418488 RepID=UPI003DA7793F
MSAAPPEAGPMVLLVDDEPSLVQALDINLRARGYRTVTARDGRGALEAMTERHIDLVVLDLGLPDRDGLEVLTGIRGWSRVPVIVLSARHTSDDKVEALDAGADDYMAKPFELGELLARIRAALRRGSSEPEAPVVRTGRLEIDLGASTVRRDGEEVRLTPTEWRILEVLARSADRMVGQSTLLTQVWGPGYETETQYLRTYLATLRRKLEDEPSHPVHLITEPGLGHRLVTRRLG